MELIRRMDRGRFVPELCCLKYFGPLGEVLAREIPAFTGLLAHKYDFAVLARLVGLLRREKIDAVVTVGTGGDKMFWGRLAGWWAGVPVICSALHSTGLPDHVELPNRLLAPVTDAFIAVARPHARYLAEREGCPAVKVRVIPNGVDVERFKPRPPDPRLREELGIPEGSPVAGIVAALRPEKNHALFLEAARLVRQEVPSARFLVVGDGVEREKLEERAGELGISDAVRFLGTRHDIPEVLSLLDVFVLTSHMEANPVSILEALACGKPVVATAVGSVPETVLEGETGYLAEPGNARQIAERVISLFRDPARAAEMGRTGRRNVVEHWSLRADGRGVPGFDRRDLPRQARPARVPGLNGFQRRSARLARSQRRRRTRHWTPVAVGSGLNVGLGGGYNQRMNAIAMVIDRLHVGYLGAYGNTWVRSPAIDRLAAEGFVFDQAFIESADLERFYAACWLGRHAMCPPRPGDAESSLPALLAARSVPAILLTDDHRVAEAGQAASFHEVVTLDLPECDRSAETVDQTRLAQCFAGAIEFVESARGPFLLWCHFRGLSAPWDAPREFRHAYCDEDDPDPPEWLDVPNQFLPAGYDPDELLGASQAYAGQVSVLDACVEVLREVLEGLPAGQETMLMLTSARGFPLGEHRQVGVCDEALYSELVHIPLLEWFSGGLGARRSFPSDRPTVGLLANAARLVRDPRRLVSLQPKPAAGDPRRPGEPCETGR